MTVAVGHILDHFELLEKVGQGGMAVVYRGRDRTLNRPVAVKVLHHHLAEHQEARDRFEREAHAVAKLRHENILEIFTFSGKESPESYIVTEFIDGSTLKEFITEHEVRFPEVGAMVMAQVCRALAHAHSLGILHRDVKPENIMIRSDGIVKLTDFGIAQILDLQRMTVTGQLLGSPAYMSPEHVEGKPLDFRTDIFAVGIVLYQLVAGILPFQGSNPHEILKRIADCKFRDPRHVNPRVGNELGKIILTAMARDKADRYADVSEMLGALSNYLEASGLRDARQELARFFGAPVSYQLALEARLVDHLSRRGRELMATDRVAALECFNRVLTIAPEQPEVLRAIDQMSRRRRGLRMAALGAGVGVIAAGSMALAHWRGDSDQQPAEHAIADASAPLLTPITPAGDAATEVLADAAATDAPADAAPDAAVANEPTAELPPEQPVEPLRPTRPATAPSSPPAGDSGTAASSRSVKVRVYPLGSQLRVDDGPWQTLASSSQTLTLSPGVHTITARNDCCESEAKQVAPTDNDLTFDLGYRPGFVVAECDDEVALRVDGKTTTLGRRNAIVIARGGLGYRDVRVEFSSSSLGVASRSVRVGPGQTQVVQCDFD